MCVRVLPDDLRDMFLYSENGYERQQVLDFVVKACGCCFVLL